MIASDEPPEASVVIPTRGRLHELRALLTSLGDQSVKIDVIVMDDGDGDEVRAVLAREFPEIRYYREASAKGPAFQRNRGVGHAQCEVVLSFDDDTVLNHPHIIRRTIVDLDDPRVWAVAVPYVNVSQDAVLRQSAPTPEGVWVLSTFVGAAFAIRRSVFQACGGFREDLFYMGEESDLCVRVLHQTGLHVRAGRSAHVDHLESPKRSQHRADYYGVRNAVLFAWQNSPGVYLLGHLAVTSARNLAWTLSPRRFLTRVRGLTRGYALFPRRERRPVSVATFRLFRKLRKRGPLPLAHVAHRRSTAPTSATQDA